MSQTSQFSKILHPLSRVPHNYSLEESIGWIIALISDRTGFCGIVGVGVGIIGVIWVRYLRPL